MALQTVGWQQNAGAVHTAAQLRMYMGSLQAGNFGFSATSLRPRGGVHPSFGQELVVTQTGSPSMGVLVEPGFASIAGTESGVQGGYFAVNDAQVTLSVTAAHASLPRIDIVVINVRDAFYSGVNNDIQLQVVAGTPASSPVPPTAPANSIILAQIAVGAGVTSITNANITDTRFYFAANGGVMKARTDATRPGTSEITASQLVWSMDVAKLYVWDGTNYQTLFPGYSKLAESILGGATASVVFSSIPTTYRNLQLRIVCRSDTAAVSTNLRMRFNGDTTANYDYQEGFGQQSTAGAVEVLAASGMDLREMTGANAAIAGHPGVFTIDIPWYGGTTFVKLLTGLSSWSQGNSTGHMITRKFMGKWRSTAAINSITLLPVAGNFIAGSSFALYGLP